jgi:uncharacterized glyoxalase superfamily protein PhnB
LCHREGHLAAPGGKVLHAEMHIGDARFMLEDLSVEEMRRRFETLMKAGES